MTYTYSNKAGWNNVIPGNFLSRLQEVIKWSTTITRQDTMISSLGIFCPCLNGFFGHTRQDGMTSSLGIFWPGFEGGVAWMAYTYSKGIIQLFVKAAQFVFLSTGTPYRQRQLFGKSELTL